MSLKDKLLKSKGFKRFLASLLAIPVGLATFVPELQEHLPALLSVAASLGVLGLVHAKVDKTILKFKTGSLASVVVVLLGLATVYSPLAPLVPALQAIAGALGVGAVAAKISG